MALQHMQQNDPGLAEDYKKLKKTITVLKKKHKIEVPISDFVDSFDENEQLKTNINSRRHRDYEQKLTDSRLQIEFLENKILTLKGENSFLKKELEKTGGI